MSLISILIIIGVAAVILALIIMLIAKQYRKVGPNEALIISGRKKRIVLADGTRKRIGFRYRLGGGTFVWPFLETVDTLPLDIINILIKTPE